MQEKSGSNAYTYGTLSNHPLTKEPEELGYEIIIQWDLEIIIWRLQIAAGRQNSLPQD